MLSSGMWRRAVLIRTEVSEECDASHYCSTTANVVPRSLIVSTIKRGENTFLRNVGSYKSQTSKPRREKQRTYKALTGLGL
jgi:hypothetical protein